MALLGSLAMFKAPAASADDWCWSDPLVQIDGRYVDLSVAIQGTTAQVQAGVTAINYTVHVAPGTPTQVVFEFGPVKENVIWVYDGARAADGSQTVRVDVSFQSTRSLPAAFMAYQIKLGGQKVSLTGTTTMGTTAAPMSTSFVLK